MSRRYYVMEIAPQFRVYLAWDEGQRVERLMQVTPSAFLAFTDLAGSPVTVAWDAIVALYASTPETRERDHALEAERVAEGKRLSPPEWQS